MHPQKEALELFAREIAPAGTSWSPGTTGADGRPPRAGDPQFAFLVDKSRWAERGGSATRCRSGGASPRRRYAPPDAEAPPARTQQLPARIDRKCR